MSFRSFVLASAIGFAVAAPSAAQQPAGAQREPDVIFVPTPPDVVAAMLKVAKVTSSDVVYDLGSGDGRILIAAAKMYGARGVGIDIDPQLVHKATENARTNGVGDQVKFLNEDLFTADISPATVVMIYLSSPLNLKLADKLMKDLKPGTRIVSHAYDMGDWKPQQKLTVSGRPIYLWTIPTPRR
jgi:protein-L-isoaspartate O-methyltransferase